MSVAGIPIPSRSAWFLTVVAIHVAAGITAVVAGAIAMLSPKKPGRHPRSGTVYFWALMLVCITMAGLAVSRWPADNALAGLGVLALLCAFIGRVSRRRNWQRWRRVHIPAMGGSYIAMLTAFYVDNGPHLPLWNRLPVAAFWVLPTMVGLPLLVRALSKHGGVDRGQM